MMIFFQVFLSLFILFPLSTAAPVDSSTQTENAINNYGQSFESKLDAASLPEFRFLNLLAHPDHSILPEQNSFHNKTELILAIGQFATAYPSLPTVNALQGQFSEKWVVKGGQEGEINNLFGTINEMVKNAQIAEADGLRTTLLALYAIGGRILGDILDDKDALIGDDDEVFVFGLKKAFTKVERVLSGLDQNEQRTVTNAELLDNVAGIGNKLDEKYGKLENEEDLHIELGTILAGGQGGDKLIGQLVAQSINERMAEVADPNGGWGYVKKDDNEEEGEEDENDEEGEEEEKETSEEQNEGEEEKGEEESGKIEEQNGEENEEMKADNAEGKKDSEAGNSEGNNPNMETNEDKKEGNNEEIKESKEVEEKKQNNNEVETMEQNGTEKEEKKGMEGNNEVEEPKEGKGEEKKTEEKNEANKDEKVESEKAENDEEEEENKVKKEIEEKKEDAKDEAIEEKADKMEETPEVKENEEKEDGQELQMKEKTLAEKKAEMPEKKKLTSNDIDAVEKEDV